jgi:hypothetical protein
MWAWLYGSFIGWIFRAQMGLLFDLFVFLTRIIGRGTKEILKGRANRLPKGQQDEKRRMAGCQEVVLFFLSQFGYIAREGMSREELKEKINSGISPEELAREIYSRIEVVPGIVLGRQVFGEYELQVKQPSSIRERHTYIIGKSGSGKTNLIKNMIMQDLELGNGIGVLAPELELLTEGILPYVPEHRIDDVVFVNPADTAAPISLNPLYLDEFENLERKISDFMTICKRVMGDPGPRMAEILRQSLKALMQRPGSTLLDIEPLLSREDATLRDEIIKTADERTARFFRNTYPSYGKDAHLPVNHYLSPLLSEEAVRSLLCNPGRPFNFRRAIDEGKVLLFNLSDGILGEQASQILGQLIISKIQLIVMSRADTLAEERRPFYLYLDEFQTFTGKAGDSYANILSRARKYKFGVVMAHQQTRQIDHDLLSNILGNVSTILTFSVANDDAQRLSREYVVGEGRTEGFTPPQFIRLRTGEAIGKIDQSVFRLRTYPASNRPDFERAKVVITDFRQPLKKIGQAMRPCIEPSQGDNPLRRTRIGLP